MKKARFRSSHLPQRSQVVLEPRKSPVQARSAASVEAILVATIQVLLRVGKERLTTTRVALRAGVSVGTLYQYFPNKSALLQAVLTRHLSAVANAVQQVCAEQRGGSPQAMVTALINGFFAVKMKDVKTSVALYSVSSSVDGVKILKRTNMQSNHAIAAMFASAPHPPPDPELAATMLQGALAGVSRRLLESPAPEKQLPSIRGEMIRMATAYLNAIPQS